MKINPNSKLSPDSIPTLISKKQLDILLKGDPEPYYKTQEIDYSEPANGYYYMTSFFVSFNKVMKDSPIPGAKDGHHTMPGETGPFDFYLIGAKIDKVNKKVYFKNYIPLEGFTTSNKSFIKAAKLNTIDFSLVSWTKDKYIRDADGNIERVEVIEHVRGARNDAVGKGEGAMKMKTNLADTSKKEDKKSNEIKEAFIMAEDTYNEILKNLNNGFDNRKLSRNDVAKDLGMDLVTDKHLNAIARIEAIEKLTGPDPEKTIQDMINERNQVKKDNFLNIREKLMKDNFGDIGTKEKPNLKRDSAEPLVNKEICTEDVLKAAIETAKKNAVVLSFATQGADETSKINDITGVVQKDAKTDDKYSGRFIKD